MDPTDSTEPILQLTFTAGTLTVRGERRVILSDTDTFAFGDPSAFTADGIIASRRLLVDMRYVTEADLDEMGIPRDVRVGWHYPQPGQPINNPEEKA